MAKIIKVEGGGGGGGGGETKEKKQNYQESNLGLSAWKTQAFPTSPFVFRLFLYRKFDISFPSPVLTLFQFQ